MAVREAIQVGDPKLKAPNKEIDDFKDPKLKQVVEDLVDTIRAMGLIGMAAPQIGENYKVFVTEPRETKFRAADQTDKLRVYINPKITKTSAEQSIIHEGCGSFVQGQLFGPVKRPKEITIEAQDLKGRRFRLICDGILARVIQHEYDHLDGIEFIEKVTDLKKLINADLYLKDIRNSKEQVEASKITKKKAAFVN
jgi:peptide deformylase